MLIKPWLLRLHGWIAVIAAIPLLVLIVTGAILSVEPIVQRTPVPAGALAPEKVLAWLDAHDSAGKARGLVLRSYEGTLTIAGAGPAGEVEIDLATGKPVVEEAGFYWSDLFGAVRGLHEHLVVGGVALAVPATIAMMVIVVLGVLMGIPRIRNTVSGWHKAISWGLLPLVIASPLTALLMAGGIGVSLGTPSAGARPAPVPIKEAVSVIAREHDLANLIWLRQRGGRQLVRLWDGGEARVYTLSAQGLAALPRNWPRLVHEGNFAGAWSGAMNLVLSLAFLALTFTGLWIFVAKQRRKFANRRLRLARENAQVMPG